MPRLIDSKPSLSGAEVPLEVARERIDPDAFDWLIVSMQSVELATVLSVAEMLPVGGLVVGAEEARLLDKGFDQHRPIGVAGLVPFMRRVTAASRSQAPRLEVSAVREEHRILHHQHRITATGHARRRRFPMRLQDPRRTHLRVVEQPIRRLRARPSAARLVDRRSRRLGQVLRGCQQATVQTFIAQISAGKLPRHPLGRLCASVHDSFDVDILERLDFPTQSALPRRTSRRSQDLSREKVRVQRFFLSGPSKQKGGAGLTRIAMYNVSERRGRIASRDSLYPLDRCRTSCCLGTLPAPKKRDCIDPSVIVCKY
jgi:hypothetical protein